MGLAVEGGMSVCLGRLWVGVEGSGAGWVPCSSFFWISRCDGGRVRKRV